MNMQSIMMQAKKMQKDIEKSQKELEDKIYEGESQLVSVKMNGKGKVISVNVNIENFSSDDKEILEDMILIAINNAVDKVESDKEEKFGKYGKMFNGLM